MTLSHYSLPCDPAANLHPAAGECEGGRAGLPQIRQGQIILPAQAQKEAIPGGGDAERGPPDTA